MEKKKFMSGQCMQPPDKIWNKVFISVFVANMLMNMSKQMMNTLISRYATSLGADAVAVGIVSSMFAVSALLFKVLAGPVNDTYNRKYVLMSAMIVMSIAYFGYGCSGTVEALMVFRLVQGAGQAFTATCCLALASDALPPEKFGIGIGYFSLATVICQTIGPTVGLWLSDRLGYRVTFFFGACLMLIAAFMATRVKTNHVKMKKFKISLNHVVALEALLPAVMMMLMSAAFSSVHSFLVIYADVRGVGSNIGFFFTVYAIAMLFTRPLAGKISDRLGMIKVFVPALCFYAFSFWLISISDSLLLFLLAAVVAAFGYGICVPSVQTLCMKCVTREKRGAASSTNYIGDDLGNLIGPTVAGAAVTGLGYQVMWRVMIIPVALTLLLALLFRKRINTIDAESRAE